MLRLFVTCCCLSVSIGLHAQNLSLRDSLVDRLAQRNYVTGSLIVTGLYQGPLQIDPQYSDYAQLLPLLREEDLFPLFRHDSLAVAAFAFKAAVERFPHSVVPMLRTESAQPRAGRFPDFLNTCQGTVMKTLFDFMLGEIWLQMKTGKLELSKEDLQTYEAIKTAHRTGPASEKDVPEGF